VLGIGPTNDILFTYKNEAQGLAQTFGVNLKYYRGHQKREPSSKANESMPLALLTSDPAGIYTFKAEFTDTQPLQYSNSTEDGSNVVYQKGQFLEQYTITFSNLEQEQAIIRVRFSPSMFEELIQFEVELNSVPIQDGSSKDVIVNWKMYNDFDPKGEFWTDSNGLEMQKRQIDKRDGFNFTGRETHVSRNYYPIDSAIAMRDKAGGKIQVTVMNDRPQGGSADLSDKATIEIMQHRRQVQSDPKNGFDEALNETDSEQRGIRVNA